VFNAARLLGFGVGPVVAGALLGHGFIVPFAVGAALSVVGFALVYIGVDETVPPA
jgi:MFS family permease